MYIRSCAWGTRKFVSWWEHQNVRGSCMVIGKAGFSATHAACTSAYYQTSTSSSQQGKGCSSVRSGSRSTTGVIGCLAHGCQTTPCPPSQVINASMLLGGAELEIAVLLEVVDMNCLGDSSEVVCNRLMRFCTMWCTFYYSTFCLHWSIHYRIH
jgi:hypothetical protein